MVPWPYWWYFALVFSFHVRKRMLERRFTEVDLRAMLEHATGVRADIVAGRFAIETSHEGQRWEVIVEPELDEEDLVVVTAYPVTGEPPPGTRAWR